MVDGYLRAYIVYVPRNVQDFAPVVFMFHGSGGDGFKFLRKSGWREKANEVGLVAVFPTGVEYCKLGRGCERGRPGGWTTKWHDYALIEDDSFNFTVKPSDYPETSQWPAADVSFTHVMIDDLLDRKNGLNVNPAQIYTTGFSAGASFSARLAVEVADRFAAAGYFSGGLIDVEDPANLPSQPVAHIPVYAMFGANDIKVMGNVGWDPDDGELPLDPETFLDIDRMVSYFIKPHLDGFEHHYSPVTLQPFEVTELEHATLYRWDTNPSGGGDPYTLMLGVFEGVRHNYPNGCRYNNPYCFVAADIFWMLFQNGPDVVFSLEGSSGN